MAFKNIKTSN